MTEAQQKRFYFPAWRRCAEANGWRMVKGWLQGQRTEDGGQSLGARLGALVWDHAQDLAAAGSRAVTLDDLRHGCHIIAVGRDKSSADLSNAEVDRVVTLFRLLADADDLGAVMSWDHPEIGERKRLVRACKSAAPPPDPEAYIDTICRGKFAGKYTPPFWEDLPIWALRQLALTLRGRSGRREIGEPRGALAEKADCPF